MKRVIGIIVDLRKISNSWSAGEAKFHHLPTPCYTLLHIATPSYVEIRRATSHYVARKQNLLKWTSPNKKKCRNLNGTLKLQWNNFILIECCIGIMYWNNLLPSFTEIPYVINYSIMYWYHVLASCIEIVYLHQLQNTVHTYFSLTCNDRFDH